MKKMHYLFISILLLIAAPVHSQTTITLDADPKSAGGVQFDPDLNPSYFSIAFGALSTALSSGSTRSSNIYTDVKIDISRFYLSYNINSQGASVRFYSDATLKTTKSIAAGGSNSSGWYNVSGATFINRIEIYCNGTSSSGAVDFQQVEFTISALSAPSVTTSTASGVTDTEATLNGNVTADGGLAVTSRGFEYSTTNGFGIGTGTTTTSGSGTGTFNKALSGLTDNTTYYYKAFATNSQGTTWGSQQSFITLSSAVEPTLAATTAASSITATTASSGGNVTDDGGDAVTARGSCWNTGGTPTTADSKTTDGAGTGVFVSSLTGLASNTLFYIRSYATNSIGTSYGSGTSFRTLSIVPNPPTVNNASSTTLDVTLAVDGNNAATTFAIQETSTGDYVQANGSLSGSAVWQSNATWGTVTVTGLTRATEYTFQVKARNSDNVETAFGTSQAGTTLQTIPTLASTTEITDNVGTTASSGGNISDNGGSAITVRGVCWNTTGTPTTADDKTSDGTGIEIFTSNITGLTPGETYYVRAYATNGIGTGYGNQLSFTTPNDPPVLAAISPASSITESSAETGCEITDGGTTVVTVRGVCWNTTGTPTTADDKTSDGTGTGVFSSSIEGLDPNTTYHVRAYATNGGGTTYSNETSFTTLNLSVAISNFIKNTDTEYELTADITNPSSIQITAKGYVWSTSQNPTTTLNSGSTSNGTGDASFTDNATITIGPGYYVRAYITTAGGTYYSDEIHFGVVPTLPEWGLIFLAAGFILGGGWFAFRKMW